MQLTPQQKDLLISAIEAFASWFCATLLMAWENIITTWNISWPIVIASLFWALTAWIN